MECNGFKIRSLNPDCTRVAIKSNSATSWFLTYKKWHFMSKPEEYVVGINRDELIVISFQSETGGAVIEIIPLGEKVGTIIVQSSRKATKTLRVGTGYRFELDPGESLVLRNSHIVYPQTVGAGLSV